MNVSHWNVSEEDFLYVQYLQTLQKKLTYSLLIILLFMSQNKRKQKHRRWMNLSIQEDLIRHEIKLNNL